MYVCVCVYIYIYAYIGSICVYIYICLYICIYTYAYIGVLGYIGIVWPKEHSPEVWSVPPVTSCIYIYIYICVCVCVCVCVCSFSSVNNLLTWRWPITAETCRHRRTNKLRYSDSCVLTALPTIIYIWLFYLKICWDISNFIKIWEK
jgi:hypothetical protein